MADDVSPRPVRLPVAAPPRNWPRDHPTQPQRPSEGPLPSPQHQTLPSLPAPPPSTSGQLRRVEEGADELAVTSTPGRAPVTLPIRGIFAVRGEVP